MEDDDAILTICTAVPNHRPRNNSITGQETRASRTLPLDKYSVMTHVVRGIYFGFTVITKFDIAVISCSERGGHSPELAPYHGLKLWPKALSSYIL
jgi:hypothetical protein